MKIIKEIFYNFLPTFKIVYPMYIMGIVLAGYAFLVTRSPVSSIMFILGPITHIIITIIDVLNNKPKD
jgi:hypothetical protein